MLHIQLVLAYQPVLLPFKGPGLPRPGGGVVLILPSLKILLGFSLLLASLLCRFAGELLYSVVRKPDG